MNQSASSLARFIFKCFGINFGEPKGAFYDIYTFFIMLWTFSYIYATGDSSIANVDDFDVFVKSVFNGIGAVISKYLNEINFINR